MNGTDANRSFGILFEVEAVHVAVHHARGELANCLVVLYAQVFDEILREHFPRTVQEPTRWSLLYAFMETVKKYPIQRIDHSKLALNRAFGLDGRKAALFA